MRCAIAAWLVFCVVGCSYDLSTHRDGCSGDADCASGLACYRGFCVASAGSQPAPHPEIRVGSCAAGAAPEPCYEGAAASAGVGACRAGMRFCVQGELTHCLDQVVPGIETCNGLDDDCNGMLDDIASESCEVSTTGPSCGVSGTIVCRNSAPSCELSTISSGMETCNGSDDDCDGDSDEGLAGATCFPADESGCVQQATGQFACEGVCGTGTAVCANGEGGCVGAVVGEPEVCASQGTALDEDCDGAVDEDCPCSSDSSQDCYGGPPSGIGQGACGPGTQTCIGGRMGACMEQGLPEAESCANAGNDDDCNGRVDDIKDFGMPCVDTTKQGECRDGTLLCPEGATNPVCVGAEPTMELCDVLDQDCNGNPVNGFDLNSVERCGSCNVACSGSEVCCGGTCMTPDTFQDDADHCGACENNCGTFQYCCEGNCYNPTWSSTNQPPPEASCCEDDCGAQTCCGTTCVDLQTDLQHCGACGNDCVDAKSCRNGTCR